MLVNFGYVGLFLLAALLFAATTLLLPVTLRWLGVIPHRPNPTKTAPFECGMETVGRSWVQYNFRYYFYALVFIALDVMVVFLYPWAVAVRELGLPGLGAILIFIAVILVGYIYAWKKKALEWK